MIISQFIHIPNHHILYLNYVQINRLRVGRVFKRQRPHSKLAPHGQLDDNGLNHLTSLNLSPKKTKKIVLYDVCCSFQHQTNPGVFINARGNLDSRVILALFFFQKHGTSFSCTKSRNTFQKKKSRSTMACFQTDLLKTENPKHTAASRKSMPDTSKGFKEQSLSPTFR